MSYVSRATSSTNLDGAIYTRISPDGNLAYVLARSGTGRVSIYDISGRPAAPTLVGTTGAITGFNNEEGFEVHGGYAFVVNRASLGTSANNALFVFDVSDPQNPAYETKIQAGTANQMRSPWGLALSEDGSHAFTVSYQSGATGNRCYLHGFNITNPASPTVAGALDVTAATGVSAQFCTKLAVRNGVAYLAMIEGGIVTVDVSNPASLAYLGRTAGPGSRDEANIALSSDGKHAFVASSGAAGTFDVYNVETPSNPTHVTTLTNANLAASYGLSVRGNYAFVGADTAPAFTAIDVSNPANPVIADYISNASDLDEPGSAAFVGKYAIVPSYSLDALAIVDLGCDPLGGAATGTGGGQCSNPSSPEGTMMYNLDHCVMQFCDGVEWVAIGKEPPPCGCNPSPGDVCSDSTVYAGLSPDGNVPMYTTAADQGLFPWNNGNASGWTTTNQTSTVTGRDNTANLLTIDSDSNTGGTQAHLAAQACANLSVHEHNDWYLPALDELNVLYANRLTIGGFNTSGSDPAGFYWSSSEDGQVRTRHQRFSDGSQFEDGKHWDKQVRCVRR